MTAVSRDRYEPAGPPPESGTGWIATGVATGVYLMFLPVRLSVAIMFAPISWMLGSRSTEK